MNIPSGAPINEHNRAIMDAGKALENEYVSRWEEDGVLLSRPPTDPYQTGFTNRKFWLTGNLDAVIRPEGWTRGHAVELKGKDHDVIDAMRYGRRSYDEQHYYQLQVYLGFLQTESDRVYNDYFKRTGRLSGCSEKVSSGSILYVSRQRPRHTYEFTFDFEPDVWARGLQLLQDWKSEFIAGNLPARDASWKWLDQPCKWCPVKRICKADYKAGTVRLQDSNAIIAAKSLRPAYDYSIQRNDVLNRWKDKP